MLHTMYIDKKLSGVKAVQTLSRLNRTAPGKEDTFILDFVNDRQTILTAFQDYYERTIVKEEPKINHLFDLKAKLDEKQIYWESEINSFANLYFQSYGHFSNQEQAKLYSFIDPAVAGIGYPAGNPAFANCIYLDGVDDHMVMNNADMDFDKTDVRIEGWFKADAATDGQMLFERWGQIMIYANSSSLSVWVDGGFNAFSYSASGADPTQWTHFAVEVVNDEVDVYINDIHSGSVTMSGVLSEPTKGNTGIGRRYNGTQYFAGYIDEFRVSAATAADPVSAWITVHTDIIGGYNAIWHMNELADPLETGLSYEVILDDDSENPSRNNDAALWEVNAAVAVGSGGGAQIVDPVAEGIGYPYGNSNFGNCAYFDGVDDNLTFNNAALGIDKNNFMIEAWVKPDASIFSRTGGATYLDYFFDRWGQINLRFDQLAAGEPGERFRFTAMIWDEVESAQYIYAYCDDMGVNPMAWTHVRFESYQGQQSFYVNGVLAGTTTYSLAEPTKGLGRIGSRGRLRGARMGCALCRFVRRSLGAVAF